MRLAATLRLDATLQARSRLYAIGLGVAAVLGVLLRFLLEGEQLRAILPPALLLSLGSTTFMFVAALVIFEKTQGTLAAQTVTPLRDAEYLGSKAATLAAFAVVEGLLLIVLAYGTGFALGWLLLGGGSLAVLYTLFGFAVVSRHDTITAFLVPDALVIGTVIQLPILPYFGIWESPLWYLFPIVPHLVMLEAAFFEVAAAELAYAVAYAALGLVVAWRWARRAFVERIRAGGAGR